MDQSYMPVNTTFINHYNPFDYALSFDKWQLNQSMKPNFGYNYTNYIFIANTFVGPGGVLGLPADRYEIFSYAAEARGFATGQMGDTEGVFDTSRSVNLNASGLDFGPYHKGHSAQFRSTIQRRWAYWTRFLMDMAIQTP